ncbi:MAG: FAD-binding oxidoreductase [Vampirovibrionales bacterium]|nr:FAD-binding oxidoreductase [Vampirovibrionales bacterium]
MTSTPPLSPPSAAAQALADRLAQAREQGQTAVFTAQDAALFPAASGISLGGLTAIRRYRQADRILTIETGVSWGELSRLTGDLNHGLALSYPDDTTLADILAEDRPSLATGLSGGYPRDVVLGVEIATPDGLLTRAGGEVIKNVTGYDLCKLYLGAGHALGALTAVTLRLRAQPQTRQGLLLTFDADDFNAALETQRAARLASESTLAAALSACELYRDAPPQGFWQLFFMLEGFEESVASAARQLQDAFASRAQTSRLMPPEACEALCAQLDAQTHPLTLEIAGGLAQTASITREAIGAFKSPVCPPPASIQIREAAGLTLLSWNADGAPTPQALQAAATPLLTSLSAHGVTARLTRIPPGFAPLAEAWNLPREAETALRAIHARLKRACDPAGVIYSGIMPLHALLPEYAGDARP